MREKNDSLGNRIKKYEDAYRIYLTEKLPIICRIDGKNFHQYTANLEKPVDINLVNCMNETAKFLCQNIQGCQMAFIQSDEISLLINNKEINTQPWFDNNLQKMVSISAAMASVKFTSLSDTIFGKIKPATFDSRVFILPEKEVINYMIWRQTDTVRNSIQSLARSLYSHKELYNKDNSALQELCFQKGVNWNDCPISQKRGRCIVKIQTCKEGLNPKTGEKIKAMRSEWVVDNEIPIFSKNRTYIDQYILSENKYG